MHTHTHHEPPHTRTVVPHIRTYTRTRTCNFDTDRVKTHAYTHKHMLAYKSAQTKFVWLQLGWMAVPPIQARCTHHGIQVPHLHACNVLTNAHKRSTTHNVPKNKHTQLSSATVHKVHTHN
eukprot:GDKI01009160.1.p1 GENE.GDKI01009160.1~~GDKI01009160.1.p1  ORF type:complete len:121 (+),score=24.75 GDKI01009160.1:79-441(+)